MTDDGTGDMFRPLSPEERRAGEHIAFQANTDDYKPVVPVPENTPDPDWDKLRPKEATGDPLKYTYYTADGGLAFYVARWESRDPHDPKRKVIRPVSWDGSQWQLKAISKDRPLYNLPVLMAAPKDSLILVVEGEQCANALAKALEDAGMPVVVTTWSGGAAIWRLTDWTSLTGHKVGLIADADKPGREAMKDIAAHLNGLVSQACLYLPEGNNSDDIVDWLDAVGLSVVVKRINAGWKKFAPEAHTLTMNDGAMDDSFDDRQTGLATGKKGSKDSDLAPVPDTPMEPQTTGSSNVASIHGGSEGGNLSLGSQNNPYQHKDGRTLEDAVSQLGYQFRWNIRAKRVEFRFHTEPLCKWHAFDDRLEAVIKQEIAENFYVRLLKSISRLKYGRESWKEAVNFVVYKHQVDPFLDLLESFEPWDAKPRVDDLLQRLFGAADDPLSIWASGYLLMGAVQRTLEPGCKLDEIPVLIGNQGIGKSAFLRELLPPNMSELFSDGLCFDDRPADQVQAILGRVIVEVPEMAGRRRALKLSGLRVSSRARMTALSACPMRAIASRCRAGSFCAGPPTETMTCRMTPRVIGGSFPLFSSMVPMWRRILPMACVSNCGPKRFTGSVRKANGPIFTATLCGCRPSGPNNTANETTRLKTLFPTYQRSR